MRMLALLVIAAFVLTWVTVVRLEGRRPASVSPASISRSISVAPRPAGVTEWRVVLTDQQGLGRVFSATTTLQIILSNNRQVIVENGEAEIRCASGEVLTLKPLPARP
jgi:hypothetical protein